MNQAQAVGVECNIECACMFANADTLTQYDRRRERKNGEEVTPLTGASTYNDEGLQPEAIYRIIYRKP